MKTIPDPHHETDIIWGYENGKFYHKVRGNKNWVEMKKIHITIERIKTLHKLINL